MIYTKAIYNFEIDKFLIENIYSSKYSFQNS
jgi:hypothetical protein